MNNKKLGMKWFVFFTQIVPLISILELIIAIISLFDPEYRQANFGTISGLIFEVIMYIEVAMTVGLFFIVRKKSKFAITYINILLIIQSVGLIYATTAANMEIIKNTYAVALLVFMMNVLVTLFWYFPNIKYFYRRRWYLENKEIEEDKDVIHDNQEQVNKISKIEKSFMIAFVSIAAITSLISAALIEAGDEILDAVKEEFYKAQEKADFLDENVVFIITDDDKYYYTYDQFMQLTGDEILYWVCTDVEAQELGYKKWQ